MARHGICENCKWWDNSVGHYEKDDTGRCVALPPRTDWKTELAIWPLTESSDWCASYLRDPDAEDDAAPEEPHTPDREGR